MNEPFQWRLLAPRHWPVWFGLGILRVLVWLPYRAQLLLGASLGRLLALAMPARRRIARRNLKLCFPERTAEARAALLDGCFGSLGKMLFEAALAWWGSPRRLRPLGEVIGLEHLEAARRAGQGVLLLAPHFTTMEIGGRLLCLAHDPQSKAGLYREHGNPALQWAVRRARSYAGAVFERSRTRAAARHLLGGGLLWYAPDQDYERGVSVFAPFFGIPAATTTSTLKLARMGRARVLLLAQRRLPGAAGYRIEITAPFEGLPTDDPVADLTRINAAVEEAVRACPEQYLWVHRRFKRRPGREPSIY